MKVCKISDNEMFYIFTGQSLATISMSTTASITSPSETSSVSGWQSETSHTTTDDTHSVTTQKLSKMDMQTLGRRFKEMVTFSPKISVWCKKKNAFSSHSIN